MIEYVKWVCVGVLTIPLVLAVLSCAAWLYTCTEIVLNGY